MNGVSEPRGFQPISLSMQRMASFSVGQLVLAASWAILTGRGEGLPLKDPLGANNQYRDVAMKQTTEHHANTTTLPIYVHRVAERRGASPSDSWGALQRASQIPLPDVPMDLCVRITGKAPHELSRTSLSVIDLLLNGDLLRLRSEEVADAVHISPTTLRRRLRADGIHYQSILDQVRRHRCTWMLEKRWLPGKCVAWELGYAEVNSFYRAFRRWTGHNYSDLKRLYI